MIEDADMKAAWAAIGRTPEGVLAYRYLQRELQRISATADTGALQVLHGRRTFAHDLMALMAEGVEIQTSGGRSGSPGGSGASDEPAVFEQRHAANVSGHRGARRRVQSDPDNERRLAELQRDDDPEPA